MHWNVLHHLHITHRLIHCVSFLHPPPQKKNPSSCPQLRSSQSAPPRSSPAPTASTASSAASTATASATVQTAATRRTAVSLAPQAPPAVAICLSSGPLGSHGQSNDVLSPSHNSLWYSRCGGHASHWRVESWMFTPLICKYSCKIWAKNQRVSPEMFTHTVKVKFSNQGLLSLWEAVVTVNRIDLQNEALCCCICCYKDAVVKIF